MKKKYEGKYLSRSFSLLSSFFPIPTLFFRLGKKTTRVAPFSSKRGRDAALAREQDCLANVAATVPFRIERGAIGDGAGTDVDVGDGNAVDVDIIV